MSILLTGGSGKVAAALARQLKNASIPVLVTSRKGQEGAPAGFQAAKLDWFDHSTFEPIFQNNKISAINIVGPLVPDPAEHVNPFIDVAVKHGVKRFTMIGGTTMQKAPHWLGKVWMYLDELKVEYGILRPSWFNENLIEAPHLPTIKDEGKIYSGCGDGKAPWVTTEDIAAVAFGALTSPEAPQEVYNVLGPEFITFDDIAATISKTIGRPIQHVNLSGEDNAKRIKSQPIPEFLQNIQIWLEIETAKGNFHDESLERGVEKATGRPATKFSDWAEKNKASWQ